MNTSSLLSIIKGIKINKVLNATNKTISFVRESIPIYNQVKPIFGKTKDFIKNYNDKNDKVTIKRQIKKNVVDSYTIDDSLTFFQ